MKENHYSFKDHKISFLFAALSIIVVLFHTSRFWVLYDLSFILEHAYRIVLGQMPYKDFFLPYPPGTFLIQAFIIKIFGTTLYPQVFYCSLVSFLTYILAYRILFFINNDKWLNIILALPIAITGGYGIMSQPFYDPDCVFVILIGFYFILYSHDNNFPVLSTFLAGVLCVMPLFFKQNSGLTLLILIQAAYLGALVSKNCVLTFKKYLWFLSGSLIAMGLILIYIGFSFGLWNYINNIILIPYRIRLSSPNHYLYEIFGLIVLRRALFWIFIIIAVKYLKIKNTWLNIITAALLLLPVYLIPLATTLTRGISYFEPFLTVWNITIVVSLIIFVYAFFKINDIPVFIKYFFGTNIVLVFSALLSQGSTGSTYGLWPMLSIMLALLYLFLSKSVFKKAQVLLKNLIIINSLAITISVGVYVGTNYRWSDFKGYDCKEEIHRSTTGNLKGLSLAGNIIPDMDNLIAFVQKEIPEEDTIVYIPHDDPFYFGSGRTPNFPIYMTDWNSFIYETADIVNKVKAGGVKWLIVKTNLQNVRMNDEENVKLLQISSLLKKEFMIYKSLPSYDIYIKKN